jgi:hypothetical protein
MPTTIAEYVSRSTLKREFASLAFFLWMGWGGYLTQRLPTTQIAPDAALSMWGSLTPYMFALVTTVFTQDWISKQTTIAGPPMNTEIKTETTVSEGSAISTTSSTPVDPASVQVDPPTEAKP